MRGLFTLPTDRSNIFNDDHFLTVEATKRNILQDNGEAVNLVHSKAEMD